MPLLANRAGGLGWNDALEFAPQPRAARYCAAFVFFNALSGERASWDASWRLALELPRPSHVEQDK